MVSPADLIASTSTNSRMRPGRPAWVERPEQPHRLGLVDRDAPYLAHRSRDQALDLRQPFGCDRSAGGIAHFEAVVGRRVVAGRDVDRPKRVVMDDMKRDRRGRGRSLAKVHRDAVAGDNLGCSQGEFTAGKALVVADDDATSQRGRPGDVPQIVGKALCAAPHVVKRVVLADPPAPAVGAEKNGGHGCFPCDLLGQVNGKLVKIGPEDLRA